MPTHTSKPKTAAKQPQKKLVIIDGNAILFRAFFGLPPFTTKDGLVVNAVYGFITALFKVLKDVQPDYLAVAFDVKGPTFRNEMYKEYKGTRKEQAPELYAQIPMVQEIVEALDIPLYTLNGYEADDIIGTIAKQVGATVHTTIVTGDMDITQLVDETTVVYMPKGNEVKLYDIEAVKEKFGGLTPLQVIDYKGLRGDPSDNIPGVRGIGDKGAIKLLTQYGSVENVIANIEEQKGAMKTKLETGKEDAILSKQLATIECNAPIEYNLDDMVMRPFDTTTITKLLTQYEFKSLFPKLEELRVAGILNGTRKEHNNKDTVVNADLRSLPEEETTEPELSLVEQEKENPGMRLKASNYELVTTKKSAQALVKQLKQVTEFAFDTETTGLDPMQCELVGFSVAWEEDKAYYITAELVELFKPVFESKTIGKIAHNAKFDNKVLQVTKGITVTNLVYDTLLAAYVLNPGGRGLGLDALAMTEFGYVMMSFKELVGTGKKAISIKEVPLETLAFYAAEDADITWKLYQVIKARLTEAKMDDILEMDMQLIDILADMEMAGIELNPAYLKRMSTKLGKRITEMEQAAYAMAGEEFNLASPKQLQGILFENLKIDPKNMKKTKTGISTAAAEMEKIKGSHEMVDLILEYREVAKLKSTYVDSLPELVNPTTKRIHTTYSQTIAATGRLASNEPNLQNIPIRTELGKKVRKAFVAATGKVLLSLDYSQIELRIAAHMSKDNSFINAFNSGADVHTRTAAEINGISDEEVTKEMRRSAKSVNFGILYGMGVYGLSRDSGFSFEESKAYLAEYFTQHVELKQYIEDMKAFVHKNGYVQTLLGRKRFLPDVHSGLKQVQAAAERAATNSPIQGTAADLMKIAMIDVAKAIDTKKVDATMLLQVHDELVFEVDEDKVEQEAKKIKTIMERAYTLDVPLLVDVAVGKNWYELKDIEI